MQRKTWYSILEVDAMPLSLKNLLLSKYYLTNKNRSCLICWLMMLLFLSKQSDWLKKICSFFFAACGSVSDPTNFYNEDDFDIGKTICIAGKILLILVCKIRWP